MAYEVIGKDAIRSWQIGVFDDIDQAKDTCDSAFKNATDEFCFYLITSVRDLSLDTDVYIKSASESLITESWSRDWPIESGLYWFYGSAYRDSQRVLLLVVLTKYPTGDFHIDMRMPNTMLRINDFVKTANITESIGWWLPIPTPQLIPGRDYDA